MLLCVFSKSAAASACKRLKDTLENAYQTLPEAGSQGNDEEVHCPGMFVLYQQYHFSHCLAFCYGLVCLCSLSEWEGLPDDDLQLTTGQELHQFHRCHCDAIGTPHLCRQPVTNNGLILVHQLNARKL